MTNKKKEPTIIYQDNFTDVDFVEYVLLALEDIEVITPEEYNLARTQGADLYPGLFSLFDISPKTFYRHFVEQDDNGCWFAECLHVHLNMDQPEYFLRDGVGKSDFRNAIIPRQNDLLDKKIVGFFSEVLLDMEVITDEEERAIGNSKNQSRMAQEIDRCIEFIFQSDCEDGGCNDLMKEIMDDEHRLILTDSEGTLYVISSFYDLDDIASIILSSVDTV